MVIRGLQSGWFGIINKLGGIIAPPSLQRLHRAPGEDEVHRRQQEGVRERHEPLGGQQRHDDDAGHVEEVVAPAQAGGRGPGREGRAHGVQCDEEEVGNLWVGGGGAGGVGVLMCILILIGCRRWHVSLLSSKRGWMLTGEQADEGVSSLSFNLGITRHAAKNAFRQARAQSRAHAHAGKRVA